MSLKGWLPSESGLDKSASDEVDDRINALALVRERVENRFLRMTKHLLVACASVNGNL